MTDYEDLQKRCQRGATNLNDADNLLAECHGMLGQLGAQADTMATAYVIAGDREHELRTELKAMHTKIEQLECMVESYKIDAKIHREAAEVAAKKLRSAEICHPRAVDTLIGEAREALSAYLPEGWPEPAMSKEG